MEPPGGRDSRFNLGYSMNLLSGETPPEIYGGSLGRPSTSLQQLSPRHTMVSSACGTRGIKSDVCYDDRGMPSQQGMGFEASGVNDINDESYNSLQAKKSPPSNGKKTKGRVKIKMEYIENKLRRYTTFSKRKTGIMKKAYELSTLTGTQVMLLVASETGHVYTFATRKLQPMITSEAGKALIQTCLNSPDPPVGSAGGDQRMSATGFEETELTYNVSDEESKENECDSSGGDEDDDYMSDEDSEPPEKLFIQSDFSQIPEKYSSSSFQDSQKLSDSSTLDSKRPNSKKEDIEKNKTSLKQTKEGEDGDATIINQIKQINNALIMSNKAKAATSSAAHSTSNSNTHVVQPTPVPPLVSTVPPLVSTVPPLVSTVPPLVSTVPPLVPTISSSQASQPPVQLMCSPVTSTPQQPQGATQLPGNVKAVPLLVQTANGVGFASVSEGMILGMIQGSSEPKFVAMPLNSIAASGIGVTMSVPAASVKNDGVR